MSFNDAVVRLNTIFTTHNFIDLSCKTSYALYRHMERVKEDIDKNGVNNLVIAIQKNRKNSELFNDLIKRSRSPFRFLLWRYDGEEHCIAVKKFTDNQISEFLSVPRECQICCSSPDLPRIQCEKCKNDVCLGCIIAFVHLKCPYCRNCYPTISISLDEVRYGGFKDYAIARAIDISINLNTDYTIRVIPEGRKYRVVLQN